MGWCPNTEAFKTKANEQRELGWGPNKKKCNKHFHGQSKLGWPQLGEVRSEIQQAKQAEIILRILLCIIFFHS
ncbi:hypothetical protein HMPREF2689_00300 [Staphylococcus sp. HMSC070D07]|nr:hypothetical protein HMPREF2689_00300 [Staphylococcus sp. HMSC070D07]